MCIWRKTFGKVSGMTVRGNPTPARIYLGGQLLQTVKVSTEFQGIVRLCRFQLFLYIEDR